MGVAEVATVHALSPLVALSLQVAGALASSLENGDVLRGIKYCEGLPPAHRTSDAQDLSACHACLGHAGRATGAAA